MVLKLVKHEIKYLGRYLLLIWAGLLLMVISQRILTEFLNSEILLISVMATMAVPLLIMALVSFYLVTFVVVVLRFYQNMFTGEGYLTFTLPVKVWQIIFSKLVVGALFMFIPLLVSALTVLSYIKNEEIWYRIIQLVQALLNNDYIIPLLIPTVATMFFGLFVSILDFYLAMSFGQLANRNKVIFSIIAYIGVYTVKQFLSTCVMVTLLAVNEFDMLINTPKPMLETMTGIGLVFTIIVLIIEWLLVNYLCKHKLNLE